MSTRKESRGPSVSKLGLQARGLGRGDATTEGGQTIRAPAILGILCLVLDFLEEAMLAELLQGAVERRWAEQEAPFVAFLELAQQGVAVGVGAREEEQDLEDQGSKRQEVVGVAGCCQRCPSLPISIGGYSQ
jgi:hypothetical protein